MSERWANGDEAREILVLAAQPVGDPASHAGADKRIAPGVQLEQGGSVPRVTAMHRVDKTNVVGALPYVRKDLTDVDSTLAPFHFGKS